MVSPHGNQQPLQLRDLTFPPALRQGLRTAMLANLRQIVAAHAAEALSKATMLAKADMAAIRAAVFRSIPGIAAGRSRWLSSDQAWLSKSSLCF